jgi:uncharacterized protein (DUF362 family)/Pyruvate/2-oxoacid:ferredoxin oxidoreductase delta subunit
MPGDEKVVSVVACDSYERGEVLEAVRRSIDLLGGLERFVSRGARVLVKPNLLQGASPDKCVTTHPEVVRAVSRLLQEYGCQVVIADSPGGGSIYTEGTLRRAYAASGWDEVARELGAELNLGTGYREVPNPEGKLVRRFLVIDPAVEADAIVVVSKAKTHVLTTMTGAAKNLFGVVPSLEKPSMHSRFPSVPEFSDMIVDLNQLIKPDLQVMDAVMGMEGDGPNAGEPRRIGTILASGDYTALDSVAARLMGLDPLEVGTIEAAARRGLVGQDLSEVVTVGDPIERFLVKDFKRPRTLRKEKGYKQMPWAAAALSLVRAYSLKPKVDQAKCTGCGQCVRICPRQTISLSRGKARIDTGRCIRCYCCHETCGFRAISLRRSLGGRAMAKLVERGQRPGHPGPD